MSRRRRWSLWIRIRRRSWSTRTRISRRSRM
jgi:hypothetical protein